MARSSRSTRRTTTATRWAATTAPFADLLRADGYRVRASTPKFTAETFKGIDVFIVVNAEATFEDAESDALRDWVKAGGSLLLTADHAPYGAFTQSLAARFGVTMGKGWAFDSETKGQITTQLTYSRANGLLGDLSGKLPILEGRNPSERISSVKTFTGQSLGMPPGAKALLRFSPTAREAPDQATLNTVAQDAQRDGGEGLYTSGGPPSMAGRDDAVRQRPRRRARRGRHVLHAGHQVPARLEPGGHSFRHADAGHGR
jgi:hypothetical protein